MLVTMINSLKDRKYEVAMMRVSGATSKIVIFSILLEGLLLSFIGSLIGLLMGHFLMSVMGVYLTNSYHYQFTGFIFNPLELWIFLGAVLIGIIAAFSPAISSYKIDISRTLKNKI
jgi:putative ABC transport system permease protein